MVITARIKFLYQSSIDKGKFAFFPWAFEELNEP